MDLQAVNQGVKRGFDEQWAGASVEALLETNKYPRAKEEFACIERFLPKDDIILEAGCGLGPKLIHFDNKNYKILGLDYIFSALQQIRNYNPNLVLTQSDVHALPFPESTFGAYLSYGVVTHFPQGPQDAIIEAHRVLKPGGLIFMMVPASNPITQFVYDDQNFLHKLRRNGLVRKLMGKPPLQSQEEHLTYFKLHGRDEMRIILETSKFKIIHEQPMSHSFNLYLGCECFHKDTNGRTNSLAEGLAAVLRKFFPWSSCNYLLFIGEK
jgi:ubiquinone/menaquinone biosynthesis C-methylase UbiE